MSLASLTGLITGLTALAGAVGVIVAQFRHVNGPAHKAPDPATLPPVAPRPPGAQ